MTYGKGGILLPPAFSFRRGGTLLPPPPCSCPGLSLRGAALYSATPWRSISPNLSARIATPRHASGVTRNDSFWAEREGAQPLPYGGMLGL